MQVVHHPTIIAAHCEGRNWTFEGDIELRSKFWGRSIELTPVGILRLSFHDGDVYTWKKVRLRPAVLSPVLFSWAQMWPSPTW